MNEKEFCQKVLLCVNTRGNTFFDNLVKREAKSVYNSFKKKNLDDVDIQKKALNAATFRSYLEINERIRNGLF